MRCRRTCKTGRVEGGDVRLRLLQHIILGVWDGRRVSLQRDAVADEEVEAVQLPSQLVLLALCLRQLADVDRHALPASTCNEKAGITSQRVVYMYVLVHVCLSYTHLERAASRCV